MRTPEQNNGSRRAVVQPLARRLSLRSAALARSMHPDKDQKTKTKHFNFAVD